jgi:hypothetical protein
LYLYVHSYKINRTEASLCNGDSYTFNDKEYTEPGKYRDTVYTDAGVTEVQELTLTDSRSHTEIDVSNVSSYDFNGTVLTTSGTYNTKLTNEAGCDSIVTLYLGINEKCKITAEENRSLCEGQTLHLLEHESARWLGADDLDSVDWLPADITIVGKIREILSEP